MLMPGVNFTRLGRTTCLIACIGVLTNTVAHEQQSSDRKAGTRLMRPWTPRPVVDMLDLGAYPQAASDAARFTHAQATSTLSLESNLYDLRTTASTRAQG